MTISEILKQKKSAIYTVTDKATVREAVIIMNEKKIGSLIVENEKKEVAGIITERDILSKVCPRDDSWQKSVIEVMTPREELIIGMTDDTVSYVMNIMTDKRIRHLPVFEKDKLVGVVSIGDVVKNVMELSETEAKLLREHIMNPYGINIP
ncbi:CBS domain-containing protein [Spirochaeta isovalerica]|uniref:CBS domain-containing protein n=1 Tax=Spirochaeta isovalerica TaxID=150 RepID=A0A841RDE6_9SPIO|nr:CBS domain-containing protein [Spirochaeta isovalerica]MBB6481257.1 CBS domain-containing protein [Spirochaeta isovalerica]